MVREVEMHSNKDRENKLLIDVISQKLNINLTPFLVSSIN
jgi:hypothetical protein